MNNDTRIMILLTGGLLILDTLPEGARDFSPTFRYAACVESECVVCGKGYTVESCKDDINCK
ncbi:hypothetical protein Barb6XT_02996 [Bacteroidales bacterium Barb6XT]|nr:hypothetical protein Barb6XT_02996 [Bacteroidales bacterium Barb6XT]